MAAIRTALHEWRKGQEPPDLGRAKLGHIPAQKSRFRNASPETPVRKCVHDIYNWQGFDLLSGAAHHCAAALFG
jgi:hypothetical protein